MIRVLGINGSPRKYGNTYKLLSIALLAAKELGAEVSAIDLYDYEIKPCLGCLSDKPEACGYPCIIEDDMKGLYDEVLRSDALVIATPIYWYGPSGQVKNFIDRLTALENMIHHSGYSWAEGKVVGVIAVGNDGGGVHAVSSLLAALVAMGFLVPPWGFTYYASKENVEKDLETLRDAANIGRILVLAAEATRGVKRWYNPAVKLEGLVEKTLTSSAERRKEELSVRTELVSKALRVASESAREAK